MSDTDPAEPSTPPPKRTVWSRIWRTIRITAMTGLFLMMVLFGVVGGLYVAYLNLTGPYCDEHLMGAHDTCSTLTSRPGRSQQTIEHLNPAGTTPAELTAPANWHARPHQLHTYVYTRDGMREFHRDTGMLCLVMGSLLALGLGRVAIGVAHDWRSRRRPGAAAPAASPEHQDLR